MTERISSTETNETLEPETLRLVQWNVWHRSPVEDIISHLHQIESDHGQLDTLCLQEVPINSIENPDENAQAIAAEFGMDYHFEQCGYQRYNRFERVDRTVIDGIGIFSRFPLLPESKKSYLLSEGPGGADVYKIRHLKRKLLTAQIEIPGRIYPLTIGTFHLSVVTEFPWRRMKEVKRLLSHLEECDIVTCDGNTGPNSRYARIIFAARPRVDDQTETPTFNRVFGPYKVGPFRIQKRVIKRLDYIVGSPDLSVKARRIIEERGPSDHHPLLVEIAL